MNTPFLGIFYSFQKPNATSPVRLCNSCAAHRRLGREYGYVGTLMGRRAKLTTTPEAALLWPIRAGVRTYGYPSRLPRGRRA